MQNEPNGLNPGDRYEYQIADQKLIIEPIPYGRLKKLMRIVFSVMNKFGKEEANVMMSIPQLFEDNIGELVALMFDNKKHKFLTKEWIDDNVTIVDMRRITEAAMKVNGLQDFLGKMGAKGKPAPMTANTATAIPVPSTETS